MSFYKLLRASCLVRINGLPAYNAKVFGTDGAGGFTACYGRNSIYVTGDQLRQAVFLPDGAVMVVVDDKPVHFEFFTCSQLSMSSMNLTPWQEEMLKAVRAETAASAESTLDLFSKSDDRIRFLLSLVSAAVCDTGVEALAIIDETVGVMQKARTGIEEALHELA